MSGARVVGLVAVLACAAVGCSGTEPIGPDPDGTSSSTGNAMGGGGDGGAATGAGYESGSRLKVRTLVGADGARAPAGFYDSQLDVECSFGTAQDGSIRCLPPSVPAGEFYADASCTDELLAVECGGIAAPYVAIDEGDDCAGPSLFRVGAAIAPNTVYQAGVVPCQAVSTPPGFQFYQVVEEAPPSAFVGVTVEIDEN